jgi:hypothetical protein
VQVSGRTVGINGNSAHWQPVVGRHISCLVFMEQVSGTGAVVTADPAIVPTAVPTAVANGAAALIILHIPLGGQVYPQVISLKIGCPTLHCMVESELSVVLGPLHGFHWQPS